MANRKLTEQTKTGLPVSRQRQRSQEYQQLTGNKRAKQCVSTPSFHGLPGNRGSS